MRYTYIHILAWIREGEREVCEELKLGYSHKFHSVLALKWFWKLPVNQMVLETLLGFAPMFSKNCVKKLSGCLSQMQGSKPCFVILTLNTLKNNEKNGW